jgi:hypothetical protein
VRESVQYQFKLMGEAYRVLHDMIECIYIYIYLFEKTSVINGGAVVRRGPNRSLSKLKSMRMQK